MGSEIYVFVGFFLFIIGSLLIPALTEFPYVFPDDVTRETVTSGLILLSFGGTATCFIKAMLIAL